MMMMMNTDVRSRPTSASDLESKKRKPESKQLKSESGLRKRKSKTKRQ